MCVVNYQGVQNRKVCDKEHCDYKGSVFIKYRKYLSSWLLFPLEKLLRQCEKTENYFRIKVFVSEEREI